jgi:copper(I)-binding protein
MAQVAARVAVLGLCGITACHGSEHGEIAATIGSIEVSDPYVAEPVTTDAAAVYFTLSNTGEEPDSLVALSAPWAEFGQLHRQVVEGGSVRMEPVDAIELPAGGSVRLQPGGLHGMLLRLSRSPKHAERVEVVLRFARAGEVSVLMPVIPYAELEEPMAGYERGEH